MNVDEFLGFIFPGVNADDPGEAVAIGGDKDFEDGKPDFRSRRWREGREAQPVGRLYFCISTVRVTGARQQRVRKGAADLLRTWVIGLDDVGTAPNSRIHPDKIPLPPTTRIETSPGNEQWFYVLEEPVAPADAHALIEALAEAGFTDKGAKRADRLLRVPGSVNTKRGNFVARVLEHHDERLFTLARIAVGFDVLPAGVPPLQDELPELPEGQVDPKFEWLLEHGMVREGGGGRGWYPIVCPWEDGHTTDPEHGTDYHPGVPGIFSCLHGHCADKRTRDLEAWILEQDPEARLDITDAIDIPAIGQRLGAILERSSGENREQRAGQESVRFVAPPGAGAYLGELSPALRLARHIDDLALGPEILPNVTLTAKGNIALKQSTSDAKVHAVMRAIGLHARRNVMTYEVEATLEEYDREEAPENMLALLVHACQRCGMDAQDRIRHAMTAYADGHRYHPVLDWIDSRDWDGVDRIGALAATLKMRDPSLSRWRDIVVRRWLIQAMVAMTNWDREMPTDVGYCLVLQGKQDIGKSKWVQHALLPPQWVTGGITLHLGNNNERDVVRRATMTPIVELGEVEASFRKSDTAALKNFLTTTVDVYRSAYGRGEEKRPRCTGYVATVNPAGFLVDASGERRFWTLAVESCDWQHDVDLQQLWVQVAILADQGEQYWLTDKEIELHNAVSQEHQVDSDVQDVIRDLDYRRQGAAEPDDSWVHATAKELLEHYGTPMGRAFVSRQDLNARLERTGWARYATIKGKRGWWVPQYRTPLTAQQRAGLHLVRRREEPDE